MLAGWFVVLIDFPLFAFEPVPNPGDDAPRDFRHRQ